MDPFDEDEHAWPDEPTEFDPDSLGPDPPRAPSPPSPATPTGDDVPQGVSNAFWAAVLFANAGLLGVSLGAMLWYFRGMTEVGGGLFLVGVLALGMTYRRYYNFMNREEPAEGTEPDAERDPESEDTDAAGGD